jgi:carbohydrate kinase (thermoresistant glucokinase family)
MTVLVIMGVSGSGKSTVGAMLAGRLGWDFAEGDDLHPPENVAKMRSGHPLTDEDRQPWLERVAAWIREHTEAGRPGVITCSALKRRYREVLRGREGAAGAGVEDGGDVVFVYLRGSGEHIAARLAVRHGHFMPPSLLDSQLADLEEPGPDEPAVRIDIGESPTATTEAVVAALGLDGEGS